MTRARLQCARGVWIDMLNFMKFLKKGDEHEHKSPLPEIIRLSYPHYG